MSAATGKPILYSKWFSSCSHRVRIALNLKGVDFEYRATNPMTDPDYEKINPVKFVPALVDGDFVVSDSFAIILVSGNSSLHFRAYKINSYNTCAVIY
uniref:GST N-terminal domain-containing protein n=1 Tax=Aegilops tauschii subsp. strangulata TaxID=200361 RepID=A0A453LC78_AEGTS